MTTIAAPAREGNRRPTDPPAPMALAAEMRAVRARLALASLRARRTALLAGR